MLARETELSAMGWAKGICAIAWVIHVGRNSLIAWMLLNGIPERENESHAVSVILPIVVLEMAIAGWMWAFFRERKKLLCMIGVSAEGLEKHNGISLLGLFQFEQAVFFMSQNLRPEVYRRTPGLYRLALMVLTGGWYWFLALALIWCLAPYRHATVTLGSKLKGFAKQRSVKMVVFTLHLIVMLSETDVSFSAVIGDDGDPPAWYQWMSLLSALHFATLSFVIGSHRFMATQIIASLPAMFLIVGPLTRLNALYKPEFLNVPPAVRPRPDIGFIQWATWGPASAYCLLSLPYLAAQLYSGLIGDLFLIAIVGNLLLVIVASIQLTLNDWTVARALWPPGEELPEVPMQLPIWPPFVRFNAPEQEDEEENAGAGVGDADGAGAGGIVVNDDVDDDHGIQIVPPEPHVGDDPLDPPLAPVATPELLSPTAVGAPAPPEFIGDAAGGTPGGGVVAGLGGAGGAGGAGGVVNEDLEPLDEEFLPDVIGIPATPANDNEEEDDGNVSELSQAWTSDDAVNGEWIAPGLRVRPASERFSANLFPAASALIWATNSASTYCHRDLDIVEVDLDDPETWEAAVLRKQVRRAVRARAAELAAANDTATDTTGTDATGEVGNGEWTTPPEVAPLEPVDEGMEADAESEA